MKLRNKLIISFLLTLVILLGITLMMAFATEATNSASDQNLFEGKKVSILGASISTYTGISNNPDSNSTIGSNATYYTEGRHGVYVNDTWWMQLANDLGLRLLVNNSWSGSSLLYERNGTVGAYVDRCVQLHNNDGEEPDIIGIQMGTNDFQYYKETLGTADIDYTELILLNEDGSYTYSEPITSLEAAAIMLHKISVRYPDAEVYYLNISQRVDGTDELIRSFNAELKQVVEHFGAHIVDIYGSAITMADFDTYIGDGRVHPNRLGMDAYTEAFKRALLANTAYEVDTHTVSFDLDGVTTDYGDDKIVVSGDAFSCTLTAENGKELSVSVTMGGEDITDTTYANRTISIDSVIGDVVIIAEATDHKSQDYRWEFDVTDLACVSGSNTLTKNSGTTTDGVFSKTSYTLENEVVLLHDSPWIVEWRCEGTFLNTNGSSGARVFTSDNVNANYNARYIFKSNTNGIISMGEKTTNGSHNYGIALGDYGIDWTALHTYCLENRISEDGSNMVYLFVDGEEIGPMNHYYIGTKDQHATSDWLSGKDFVFPYMGTDTHGFTNAYIDYIQVWEGGHTHSYTSIITTPTCTEQGYTTYTCTCGDTYVDNYVSVLNHNYGDWYEVTPATCTEDGLERRDCTRCNVFETNVISKRGHFYSAVTISPTCTEQGYTTYTCTCGDSYVDNYVDALGHTRDKEVTENNVEPTCTADGSYDNVIYCYVCGVEIDRETNVVEASGHNYEDWVQVIAPKCEIDGVERRDCADCEKFEIRDIAAPGHEWTEEQSSKVCESCGEIIELEIDHSKCGAGLFETIVRLIINFFRILFGLPEICFCGEELR